MSLSSIHSSRITDLVVLAMSFTLFTLIIEFKGIEGFFMEGLMYVGVIFCFLRLSKRFIFSYFHGSIRTTSVLLGNALGLIAGSIVVASLMEMLSFSQSTLIVVFLSSALAFFVLGTLSPMIKSSHHDIIQH